METTTTKFNINNPAYLTGLDAANNRPLLEVEQALLYAILTSTDCLLLNKAQSLNLEAEHFELQIHQKIWTWIKKTQATYQACDVFQVMEYLRSALGPQEYQKVNEILLTLVENDSTGLIIKNPLGFRQAVILVKEKFVRRKLGELGARIQTASLETQYNISDIYTSVIDELYKHQKLIDETREDFLYDAVDLLSDEWERICKRQDGTIEDNNLSTGILDLDKMCNGGLPKGELTILTGATGGNKTSVSLNIAHHVAKKYDVPILFHSLEVAKDQIFKKLLPITLSDNIKTPLLTQKRLFASDRLTEDEYNEFSIATEEMLEHYKRIYISDDPQLDLTKIIRNIEEIKRRQGTYPRLIVIDYVALMDLTKLGDRSDTKASKLGIILVELQKLARKYNMAVVVNAQTNREKEGTRDKRPTLHTIKDSSCFAHQASVVIGLHKEPDIDKNPDGKVLEVLLLKNRFGPTGDFKIIFENEYNRQRAMVNNRYMT